MDLLSFLLSFLSEQFKNSPILKSFSENGFDLQAILNNLNLEDVTALIGQIINSRQQQVEREFNTKPIINIADKEIVYSLNRYFYSLP